MTASARALLLGAPLGELGGVEESVGLLADLLVERGFSVERLVGPAARLAEIEAALVRLRAEVRPGDAVVLYWAGHGHHVFEPMRPQEVFPVLLPMDANESTAGDPRALLGVELARWLLDVAHAAAHDGTTNVTVILECCHASGLIDDQGLDIAGLDQARRRVGAILEAQARIRRGEAAIQRQIVRVTASGTFSRAYGVGAGTVGAVTRTLVELLRAHPHESWRALEHRLRAVIHARQPHQQPGVEGRRDRVPFTTMERPWPEGVLPCVRDAEGRWRCELGELLAAREGATYRLVVDPGAPGGTLARVDEGRASLRPVMPESSAVGTMRWALPVDLARDLRLELRDTDGCEPGPSLREALERAGVVVLPASAARGIASRGLPPALVLERSAGTLTLYDAWGEPVARWPREPPLAVVLAWASRLSELQRWLAVAATSSPMLEGVYELRWGVRHPDGSLERVDREGAELPAGSAVWIELHNRGVEPRLYLSVFRVTCDRAVEHLTGDAAGGLPSTAGRPSRMGLGKQRIVLSRAVAEGWGMPAEAPSEALVSIVTVRPLPLHGFERARLERGSSAPSAPVRAMVVARYRLSQHEGGDAPARPSGLDPAPRTQTR